MMKQRRGGAPGVGSSVGASEGLALGDGEACDVGADLEPGWAVVGFEVSAGWYLLMRAVRVRLKI